MRSGNKKIWFTLKKSLTISQRKEYVLYSDADNGTTWNAKKERLFFVTDTKKISTNGFRLSFVRHSIVWQKGKKKIL